MIEPVPSNIAQKLVVGQQSNKLKMWKKWGNSDISRFKYKVVAIFHKKTKNISLTLSRSSGHLQDTLLIKLLDQFIGLLKYIIF